MLKSAREALKFPFGARTANSRATRPWRTVLSHRPRQLTVTPKRNYPAITTRTKGDYATPKAPSSKDNELRSHPLEDLTLLADLPTQTIYLEKDAGGISTVPRQTDMPPKSIRAQPVERSHQRSHVLSEIMAVAVPALPTVLADPLMSLVDTACVGQVSAIHLAALGPNTAIFNMIFMVFGCMGNVVANQLASRSHKASGLSKEDMTQRRIKNEKLLCHTLIFAVGLGILIAGGLFGCGKQLLGAMGTSDVVMGPALEYLLIRAIATPAVLFMAVAQGACLGQQDMWTPMKVILTAGIMNLLGDIVLIMYMGMGTIGAAAATAASQIAGAIFFFAYLRQGGACGKALRLKWKGFPTLTTMKPIFEMGRVLASRNFVMFSAYTGMTTVATGMGTLLLAAHQVTLQCFWMLATSVDALSLTAQSILAKNKSNKRRIHDLAHALLSAAACSGLCLAAAFAMALMFQGAWFTADSAVITHFQRVVPHGMMALVVISFAVTLDGISIGTNRMSHLPMIMAGSSAATIGCLLLTQIFSLGLEGVWASMIALHGTRVILHVLNIIRNWRLSPLRAQVPQLEVQMAG